jgi:multiple sugar transport system substrate-binding protein
MDRARALRPRKKLSRRQFLGAAGTGVAGAALLRMAPWKAGAAPAQIKGTTLRMLQWSHFVPAFDAFFDQFTADWGKANGVTVRVDHIPQLQLPARLASERAASAGHDIFQFQGQVQTNIYYNSMVDITDLCEGLGKMHGGWLPSAKNVGMVNGRWYGYADFYIPIPMLYRKDLMDENGLKVPDNWDGWRAVARTMKPKGHPTGIQISHCNDANHNWRSVFFDFGVKETDETGKELRWDTKDLREAMKFGKALYEECMTPEVFSWDDVADNRYLASGVAIWIHDAISAWRSIEGVNPDLYKKVWLGPEPAGPKARFNVVDANVYGIWKFSKNQEAAKAFLEYLGNHVKETVTASKGYNMPFLRDAYKKPMPVIGEEGNGVSQYLQDWVKTAVTFGYPGPMTAAASEVNSTYLVPDMVGRYVRGGDLEASIKWGMDQIKEIYAKYK